jgi:hypothetical protein
MDITIIVFHICQFEIYIRLGNILFELFFLISKHFFCEIYENFQHLDF